MSIYKIETTRICHNCGHEWRLPYSVLKEIILTKRHEKNIKDTYVKDYSKELVICQDCPSCHISMCVYADDPEELKPFIPIKNKKRSIICNFKGHDFKGNLRHSLYTCKKCNQVIKYKDAKIIYLN